MKTEQLSGATLDYWVAKAEKITHPPSMLRKMEVGFVRVPDENLTGLVRAFEPSSNWTDGGPIIERAHICVECSDETPFYWDAYTQADIIYRWSGNTPLVAAMRAYVALKFGDEVPDA